MAAFINVQLTNQVYKILEKNKITIFRKYTIQFLQGLYEYGIDKLKDGLQRCVVCNDNTTKHCEKCLTYYCSKGCQITHWPVHQAHCERIP